MCAYSIDLRERIVRAVAEGQPMSLVARRFAVHVNTVKHLRQLEQETGALSPRPIPGMPRYLRGAQEALLQERLQAEPDATVLENCAWWLAVSGQQVSEATMWRAMRRLGWTHKKKRWEQGNVMKGRVRPTASRWRSSRSSSSCFSMKAERKRT